MEFAVLGRLEVRMNGGAAPLGGPKQRALLALLLLNANEVVSRDRLVDALWGERAPASAHRSLDSYVSRLRALIGADRIERRAPGYLLRVDPGELDLMRFEDLLEEGRAAAASGDAAKAARLLRQGLALWRGPALSDLESEQFVEAETARLEERRLLALEGYIDAELALGNGSELVGELEQLVAEQPFRERLIGQLMVSLYRAGRQADALAAYQAFRRRFAEELGLEPSSELREVEQRILEHDPTLTAPLNGRPTGRQHPPPRRLAAGGILVLAAVAASVVVGIKLGTGTTSASNSLRPGTGIVELNPSSSKVVDGTALRDAPVAMTADRRSLWLAEPNVSEVDHIDLASQSVDPIPVDGSPASIAIGGGAVWVASVPGDVLTRIDPTTHRTMSVGLHGAQAAALAFGFGKLWVADPTHASLLAIDPASGQVVNKFEIDVHATALAAGAGAIWAADYGAGTVTEVDPRAGKAITTITVGRGPAAIVVGDGAVWVANSLDSTVSRIDAALGQVHGTFYVGTDPVALAVNGMSVVVANEYSSSLSQIDVRRRVVSHTSPVGADPTSLVAASGRMWVGTRALDAHRGGTLVLLHERPLLLDPAVQNDLPPFQSNGLTYDALLSHVRAGGPAALQLMPDLATTVPNATDGGTSYTFRLRPGLHYWTGQPVRAEDFRRAVERLFRLDSTWASSYTGIVGATACTRRHCDLSKGIAVDDATRTITFHLRTPDPSFLDNMTSMGTAPVPRGTPFHDTEWPPIPGTGPYKIASATKHELRYIRNPRFRQWSRFAQPDGNPNVIIMRYGLSPAREVREIERGRADWTADGVPPRLLPQVMTRFPAQAHILSWTETDFLQFNTKRAPFDDPRVRRALDLAIDRAAIVRMYGGRTAATPTCQLLPPGVLGYRRYCPYTRQPMADGRWQAPDLAQARRLVAASGTRGERVTVWGQKDGGVLGTDVVPYIANVLRQLGYRARAHLVLSSSLYHAPPSLFRKVQLVSTGWLDDTPYGFFGDWLLCSAPGDHHWFCDRRLDHEIRRAHALEASDTQAAGALWRKVDRQVTDVAAALPLVNPHSVDFVSARVRDYQANPILGLIADQVWLR